MEQCHTAGFSQLAESREIKNCQGFKSKCLEVDIQRRKYATCGKESPGNWGGGGLSHCLSLWSRVWSTGQPWTHQGRQDLYWGITSIGLACGHACPHRHFVDCWWVWVILPLGGLSWEVWEEQEIFSLVRRSLLVLCFSACPEFLP